MAVAERIRRFRSRKGMTQKELGMAVGLPERSADVRVAQYESGVRSPKYDLTERIAAALAVSPYAISEPDITSRMGLMYTLFAMEDLYGFAITDHNGQINLCLNASPDLAQNVISDFRAWCMKSEELRNEEITKEAYDDWRYNFSYQDF